MGLITEKLDHFCLGEKQTKPNTDGAAFIVFPSDREWGLRAENSSAAAWTLSHFTLHRVIFTCVHLNTDLMQRDELGALIQPVPGEWLKSWTCAAGFAFHWHEGGEQGELPGDQRGWDEDLKNSTRNCVSKRPKELWGCGWRCWSTCKQCGICTKRGCAAEMVFGEARLTSSCHQPVLKYD